MSEPTEEATTEASGHTVAELRDELRERDLPTSGTKDELVARLEGAEAAETETEEESAAAEAIADADLVSDEGEIKTDSVAELADDARAAVAEFSMRLYDLVVVLTDLEARNVDPASGALTAASVKVRAHCDDVARHLGPLSAGIQVLANEATVQPA